MEIINKDALARFIGNGIIRTSNANKNGQVKTDLAGIFTKGTNTYPRSSQLSLLLLDKYLKDKPVSGATQSEETAFAQGSKNNKKKNKDKDGDGNESNMKKPEYDKEFCADKSSFRCGEIGHPAAACFAKIKIVKENASKKSSSSSTSSEMNELITKAQKVGKALT